MSARTQDKRLWLGGGAVLAALILLIGWFGVINPQLSAAATTRDQVDSAKIQNSVLQAKNAKLKAQNDNVAALRAGLASALAELPSDGGLPAFTRQISAQATANSVALTSIIVGTAAPVAGAVAPADPTTTTTTASSSTTVTDTPAAAATGLVQMTVTVSATGQGRDDLAFLKAIQVTGPRRALVTASQLAPSGSGSATGIDGLCTLTLTMTIFSAPLSPTAQAALKELLSSK